MQEFTVNSALSDPLIRTLMAADNVDPVKLESMLMRIAEEATPRRRPVARTGRDFLELSGVDTHPRDAGSFSLVL